MKELSIEQKAKDIEFVKQMIADGYISQDVAEKYFPELKESENEKIRKEILDYIIKGSESCYDIQQYGKEKFEKWIAWLEKQGNTPYDEESSKLLHKVMCKFINHPDFPYAEREEASVKILPYIESIEKQGKQSSSQVNERAWLYLVSDVLTWKDGIGQYLDDPRVQELAKKLCSEYGQKLYKSTVS